MAVQAADQMGLKVEGQLGKERLDLQEDPCEQPPPLVLLKDTEQLE